MPNIVITAVVGKTYFNVDFGDYASDDLPLSKFFWANDIHEVDLFSDKVVVAMIDPNVDEWSLSFNGLTAGTFQVDSVLGIPPTSNDNLRDLIANLKG